MRERKHEVSRLEAFSDAVFAFALTLLVVSLDSPKNYHDLMVLVRGFLPFACCFALLVWIWYEHSALFSRYDLRDGLSVVLNAGLLFVVLFYVYPLKYVMSVAFLPIAPQPHLEGPLRDQVPRLFVVYGLGYVAVFVILALLYYRAWSTRGDLRLTAGEALDARLYMGAHLVSAGVGLLSTLWALLAPAGLAAAAGLVYFLMAPAHTIYGSIAGKRRRTFAAAGFR